MKPTFYSKLTTLQERLEEVDALLSAPETAADPKQLKKLNVERGEIEPVVTQFLKIRSLEEDRKTAEDMLSDPQMKEFAADEIASIDRQIEEMTSELEIMLLPKDPDDGKNVILEIRAGTGGDESALFSGDLLRMYLRYAETQRWRSEIISASESELGGYKEVIVRLSGENVYGSLKFESGAHRVQRVPVTEAQGRIHTSACTVAVMPEADDLEEININPAELRIDTFRASGAGGQHINKTDSAVRITHLPTGIVVECQDDRSQHKNRAQAMSVLATRIRDRQMSERHAQEAATRKSLVGSGDRSERIRTYNYPQGRVTDHRINLTLYKLEAIMDGDMDELIRALVSENTARQMTELAEKGF